MVTCRRHCREVSAEPFSVGDCELRQSLPLEAITANIAQTRARNFEEALSLKQLLSKAQRMGILSARQCELVRKFHCEGFQPRMRESKDGPSAIALYYRIQRRCIACVAVVHPIRLGLEVFTVSG